MSAANVDAAHPVGVSPPQARIITAALDLFTRHGVGGTSLQMIADDIGVTKAAVYHQYRTKEEIVLAVAEAELTRLADVVAAAERAPSARRSREALVEGMVDLAIERGPKVRTILSDPVIGSLFTDHKMFRDVMYRLRRIVIADDTAPEAQVRTAMLIAALSGTVTHPFVSALDDDVLRAELLRLARRFLGLPG